MSTGRHVFTEDSEPHDGWDMEISERNRTKLVSIFYNHSIRGSVALKNDEEVAKWKRAIAGMNQ